MRAIKYNGNLITFAGKILRMAEWVYQEGIHYLRVLAGVGVMPSRDFTEEYYKMAEENDMNDNIRLAVFPQSGYNKRESGIYKFVTRLFNLANNDKLGDELIVNGGFDTDTSWIKQIGWTISGGSANYDGTSNLVNIRQAITLEANSLYEVKFNVLSGTARIEIATNGGSGIGAPSATNYVTGNHIIRFKATATNGIAIFAYNTNGGTAFSLDNFSAKKILINEYPLSSNKITIGTFDNSSGWTASNWNIANGKATCAGVSSTDIIYSALFVPLSTSFYKVTVSISDYVSGTLRIWGGSAVGYIYLPQSNGTHTVLIPNGWNYSSGFNFSGNYFVGSIDNVIIEEYLINPDVTQYTTANQPYLIRKGIKNPNGGSRYMTHPTISFAGNEAWTLSTVTTTNGGISAAQNITNNASPLTYVELYNANGNIRFLTATNTADFVVLDKRKFNTKRRHIAFAYDGTSITLFINGELVQTLNQQHTAVFNSILGGGTRFFYGESVAHIIRSGALTQEQVTAEYNFLKTYFPEIETKQIGTKEIAIANCEMVATPKGNVITENNNPSNVNGITGGDFESGLIGTKSDGDGSMSTWTLNTTNPISGTQDGRLQVTTAGTGITRPSIGTSLTRSSGQFRKISFSYKVNSGNCIFYGYFKGVNTSVVNLSLVGSGTFNQYYLCDGSTQLVLYFNGTNLFDLQLDNIKDELVGFNDASNVYTAIYNQTAGTSAEKHYAAIKAAAMWRSPNSSLDDQAVFGKIYNGYAAQLLKLDIDTYNVENPTTPWGYHVATLQDFQAIKDTLGGVETAGKKLKINGVEYWTSDNGDNTSGVEVFGSGYIDESGEYRDYKEATGFWTTTENGDMLEVVTLRDELDELFITE